MLARLERLEGIHGAETDQAGDFLRLSIGFPMAADAAIRSLATQGYGAERADDPSIAQWFGVRTVRELSFVEAGVIADRIVPQIASRLTASDARRVRDAMIGALHACFISTALTSAPSGETFRSDCVRQTVAAVRPIASTAIADEIGRLLDLDMRETHKSPRGK